MTNPLVGHTPWTEVSRLARELAAGESSPDAPASGTVDDLDAEALPTEPSGDHTAVDPAPDRPADGS